MSKKFYLLSLTALASSCAFSVAALAQESAAPKQDETAPDAQEPQGKKEKATQSQDGDIIVVGSRIRRGTRDVSQQVQIIRPEDAERTGRTTTRDILQSTMITGGGDQNISSLNLVLVNGGPGVANISLRRQGPGRTLVLLNGRRLAPAGVGGSVSSPDLNTVPTAIIEQTQILKDGASSIYGSDAIAGVIDIITRKRVEGFEFSSMLNMGQESGGERYRLSTVGGYATDRLNISFGLDYDVSRELEFGDRKRYRCPTAYLIDPAAKNPVPGSGDDIDPATGKPRCWGRESGGSLQNLLVTGLLPGEDTPTTGFLYNFWMPNANIKNGIAGMEGISTSPEVPGGLAFNEKNNGRAQYFNPEMLGQSVMGQSRNIVGLASLTYDLGSLGDAEIYLDVLGSDRRYYYDFMQPEESIIYVKGSPLIPEQWSEVDTEIPGNSLTAGKEIAALAYIFTGLRRDKTHVQFWRASGGIRGDMPMSGWRYDMTYTYAHSDGHEKTPVRLTDRLQHSMDVVEENGKFLCADAKARASGCVPIPKFSPEIFKKDGLPKAWLNYVSHMMTTRTSYSEHDFNFDFDGPLFRLPYGQAMGALGAEIIFNSLNDQPDAQSIANNAYNYGTSVITKGSGHSFAAYSEIELPLLVDVPLAKVLRVNISGRLTKGDGYKHNFSYKAGMLYTPADWLSFRASYGTSYRAPALFERYLGDTKGFIASNGIDPCNLWATKLTPGTPAFNNCKSEGVPGDFVASEDITAINRGGKSTGLRGETSRNLSLGMIVQPELPAGWGRFQGSVDYYNLRSRGGITPVPAPTALMLCYDDRNFRNGGLWCPLIGKRDPDTFALTSIVSTFLNLSQSQSRGLDFNLTYTREIGIGTLGIHGNIAYVLTNKSRLMDSEPYEDSTGALKEPRMTGTLDLNYNYKKWNFGYNLEWVEKTNNMPFYQKLEDYQDPYYRKLLSTFVSRTPHYFMHSASISYYSESWRGVFAVRNITNKMAPRISAGVDDRLGDMLYYSGYDLFGRAYTFTYVKKF